MPSCPPLMTTEASACRAVSHRCFLRRLHACGTPAHACDAEFLGHGFGRAFDLVVTVTRDMPHARITTCPMPGFGVVHAVETNYKVFGYAVQAVVDDEKRRARHVQSIPLIINDITEHSKARKIPSDLLNGVYRTDIRPYQPSTWLRTSRATAANRPTKAKALSNTPPPK